MKNDTMAPTKNRDIARSRIGWPRTQVRSLPISAHIHAATSVKEPSREVMPAGLASLANAGNDMDTTATDVTGTARYLRRKQRIFNMKDTSFLR